MTVEEFLQQRYKVISDYPESPFEIGDIRYAEDRPYNGMSKEFYDKYPYIFKKLEWWEERDIEDMPKYLKVVESGKIEKVTDYFLDAYTPAFYTGKTYKSKLFGIAPEPFNIRSTIPATEEEYNQYTNGLQLNNHK
jgi:hypothetical protein